MKHRSTEIAILMLATLCFSIIAYVIVLDVQDRHPGQKPCPGPTIFYYPRF